MYIPIDERASQRPKMPDVLCADESKGYDPLGELFDALHREDTNRIIRDHWTEAAARSKTSPTSDELLHGFLDQLATKEIADQRKTHVLSTRLHSVGTPLTEAPTSAAPQPSRASSDHRQIETEVDQSKTAVLPEGNTSTDSNLPTVECRPKCNPTQCATTSVQTDATEHKDKGVSASANIDLSIAPPPIEKSPSLPPQRLWRPTAEFYEAHKAKDADCSSSSSISAAITSAIASDTGSTSTTTESESTSSKASTKPKLAKDSSKWKQFRHHVYKVQRQRLLQRHRIYDPMLFTSSSSNDSTSESELSSCSRNKLHAESITTQD